jgi:hypothetical protein
MSLKIVWLVDTSVLCNILDLPVRNQERVQVLSDFKKRIQDGNSFLLPYAVIVETGNHIAQITGNHKYNKAEEFVEYIKKAFNGDTPFTPLKFPSREDVLAWLDGFPKSCSSGIGFADYSTIQEWEYQRRTTPHYSVRIWSLDEHLKGYQSIG